MHDFCIKFSKIFGRGGTAPLPRFYPPSVPLFQTSGSAAGFYEKFARLVISCVCVFRVSITARQAYAIYKSQELAVYLLPTWFDAADVEKDDDR